MNQSDDSGQPESTLAMSQNPADERASALRRVYMMIAYDRIPEDDRADLLEAIESIVTTRGTNPDYIERAGNIMAKIHIEMGKIGKKRD